MAHRLSLFQLGEVDLSLQSHFLLLQRCFPVDSWQTTPIPEPGTQPELFWSCFPFSSSCRPPVPPGQKRPSLRGRQFQPLRVRRLQSRLRWVRRAGERGLPPLQGALEVQLCHRHLASDGHRRLHAQGTSLHVTYVWKSNSLRAYSWSYFNPGYFNPSKTRQELEIWILFFQVGPEVGLGLWFFFPFSLGWGRGKEKNGKARGIFQVVTLMAVRHLCFQQEGASCRHLKASKNRCLCSLFKADLWLPWF